MNESWIKETTELIEDLQKRHDEIEGELSGLHTELEEIENQIIAADSLIRLYREKHKTLPQSLEHISHGYFGSKTYPEMLVDIAVKSNNYLTVPDAIAIMFQAGVNKDKRAIQANTYAALGRMVEAGRFVKVKRGEYRYSNGFQKSTSKPIPKGIKSKSGVQAAIKKLKDDNPQLTKSEVLKLLQNRGFDFKGKKPVNAVNIVWAKLGYSKEGKQQGLPGVS